MVIDNGVFNWLASFQSRKIAAERLVVLRIVYSFVNHFRCANIFNKYYTFKHKIAQKSGQWSWSDNLIDPQTFCYRYPSHQIRISDFIANTFWSNRNISACQAMPGHIHIDPPCPLAFTVSRMQKYWWKTTNDFIYMLLISCVRMPLPSLCEMFTLCDVATNNF